MKRSIVTIVLILSLSSILISCSSKKIFNIGNDTTTSNENPIPYEEKTFTVDELAKYNGKNGNPAYVAVSGVVYDVSGVDEWSNGNHKKGITAGKDLTDEIAKAPHKLKVLDEIPMVGILK
ncbi:MAG: cytochrome b5 domain-containing protein [Clostridium sp.]